MSSDLVITTLLIVALFALLGSGVWIGLALAGVAWIGMQLFSSRSRADDAEPNPFIGAQHARRGERCGCHSGGESFDEIPA